MPLTVFPKPEGGYPLDHPRGWLVVVAAFFIQFVIFGTLASFPVYIKSMEHDATLGHPTRTQIGLVSSIATGPGLILGPLGGFLMDRYGIRPIMCAVSFCYAAALVAGSLWGDSVVGLILLYSLPTTVTTGFSNSPVSAAVGSWFDRKLSLAMGISCAGGGLGSAVVPIAAGQLVTAYGWRKAWLIVTAFDVLLIVATVLAVKRVPTESENLENHQPAQDDDDDDLERAVNRYGTASPPTKIDAPVAQSLGATIRGIFKDVLNIPFLILFLVGILFGYAYTAVIFIVIPLALSYGKSDSVYYAGADKISVDTASTLFIGFGVAQTIGGFVFGELGDRMTPKFVYVVSSVIAALGCLAMGACETYVTLFTAFCIVGAAFAGNWSMYPAMVSERFPPETLGTTMGIAYAAVGIGALVGPPVSSLLVSASTGGGNYPLSLIVMSVMVFLSALLCYLLMPSYVLPTHHPAYPPSPTLLPSAATRASSQSRRSRTPPRRRWSD